MNRVLNGFIISVDHDLALLEVVLEAEASPEASPSLVQVAELPSQSRGHDRDQGRGHTPKATVLLHHQEKKMATTAIEIEKFVCVKCL